jgi:PadR family transcriptional regulator PadR
MAREHLLLRPRPLPRRLTANGPLGPDAIEAVARACLSRRTSCRVLLVIRKLSMPTSLVLQAFLDASPGETYGFELSEETGLPSGTVYPILRRLEAEGLIEGTWTTVQTRVQGRRRRYYRLTSAGKQVAAEAVAAQRETLRLHAPGWVTP